MGGGLIEFSNVLAQKTTNTMSLQWRSDRAVPPKQVSSDTSVETTIPIGDVVNAQSVTVRGMVTVNNKRVLLVAQFSDPELADGLISMLVARDAPGAMQVMSRSDSIEYKELPKLNLSPIYECAAF